MYNAYIQSCRILISAAFIGLLMAGCSTHGTSHGLMLSPANRLSGTWKAVAMSGEAITEQNVTELEMTFTAEGQWSQKAAMRDDEGMEFDEKYAAYTVQGNTITFHEPGDTHGTVTFNFDGEDLVIKSTESHLLIRLQRLSSQ
jgi:Lipocalin-like domain